MDSKQKMLYTLDLLLNTPLRYENNFLNQDIVINEINCLEVVVKNITVLPKYLKILLYAQNINKNIQATIFHPRKFHFSMFAMNSTIYIKGKIEYKYGSFQIVNPKIVKEINQIIPIYKKPNTIPKTPKKVLYELGIKHQVLDLIYDLHHPNISLAMFFATNKTFPQSHINALKYLEMYLYLYKLSFKKSSFPSRIRLTGNYSEFVKSLPFTLTNDQNQAIKDIQKDLNSNKATKRMIVGDVGCGKTMVIFASVMMSLPYRSILMVPTTILAKQIFVEATKYLSQFVRIALVTHKNKKEDLSQYDFIIGTHALLFRDIPQVELVMIDEQHRFGTAQRQKIKTAFSKGSKRVHSLQFSATPIPRSLALINSGLIDYSFIEELPFPKDIDTNIIGKKDFKNLLLHIDEEINQNHQIIIIYPLVEDSDMIEYQSIESTKDYWLSKFKNVYITHGKDKNKEQVLEDFATNGDILIATTLVEVGISLPRLSTIVIVGAERLGLASLHQLRGRVSRNGLKGYCYLYCNDTSNDRLKQFAKTSSGFDIAALDLRYRDSGDMLSGYTQSGALFHWIDISLDMDIIQSVKYDLNKLLKEDKNKK